MRLPKGSKALDAAIFFVRDNFSHISSILDSLDIEKVDGFIFDLGVSSHQLDDGERGIFLYEQWEAGHAYGPAQSFDCL